MRFQFKITGLGYYLPPHIETAEELSKKINKTERWVISRAGVSERRVSSIDVDQMGARAARDAIGDKPQPDLIINASAANELTKSRNLIIDLGTALTFCLVDKNGNYLGCLIFPGNKIASESLSLIHI